MDPDSLVLAGAPLILLPLGLVVHRLARRLQLRGLDAQLSRKERR